MVLFFIYNNIYVIYDILFLLRLLCSLLFRHYTQSYTPIDTVECRYRQYVCDIIISQKYKTKMYTMMRDMYWYGFYKLFCYYTVLK